MPQGGMQMPNGIMGKVMLIAVVPMLIIISVLTFGYFEGASQNAWDMEVTNESHTGLNTPEVVALDHPPVDDGSYTFYNDSANTQTLSEGSDFEVVDLSTGEFNITSNVDGSVYADYSGHGGAGYQEQQQIVNNSYSGFNLTSIIPIVIAGVTILTIVIGVFAAGFIRAGA